MTTILARHFRMNGVRVGSTVALTTGDMRVSIAALLATALLGSGFVIAGKTLASARHIIPTHRYRTPDATVARADAFEVIDDGLFVDAAKAEALRAADFPGPADWNDPWLNLHTSGTTGVPKYIALSQRMVWDRTRAVSGDFPYAANTMGTLFPVTSRPFYARALGVLLNAGSIVESHDLMFWRKVGVTYACASPLQASNFLSDVPSADSNLPLIEVSGAKLSEDMAHALLRHFDTVIDVYGASETSKSFANVVTLNTDGTLKRRGKQLDTVVEIIDDSGQPCIVGVIGRVRIRNDYMVTGYIGEPEATRRSFCDGWFSPGDWAMWGPEGTLDIVGRNDDVVSIGGMKINAQLVDVIVRLVPGVADAISFKNPKLKAVEELLVFIQFENLVDRDACLAAIRDALNTRLGLAIPVGNLHTIDRVPRDDEGEPKRKLCQEILLRRVAELAEPSEGRK